MSDKLSPKQLQAYEQLGGDPQGEFMPKKDKVLVFSEYWQQYGCLDESLELSSRRAWNFGVLQTQRIYLPVVQENEKLKAEIKKLKAKERRLTKRAADGACTHRWSVNHLNTNYQVCELCGAETPRR